MRDPILRELVGSRTASIPGPGGAGRRALVSKNLLLDLDPSADGIKTGFTAGAGEALVARATRPPVGSLYYAEIGAPTEARRASDGARILDWGFAQYAVGDIAGPGTPLGRIPVRDRPGTSVPIVPATPVAAALLPGEPVVETLVAPSELRAPVRRGQVVGSIALRQGGVLIARRKLVAAEDVDSPSLLDRVRAGIARVIP
jgi:D-alanyl-D-alanine carboxypeptidase (penicillin-binding protein 5/6)